MNSEEKWIKETEDSLSGMIPAQANPYLFSKILYRMQESKLEKTPLKLVWIAMSSLLMLAFLNFAVLKKTKKPSINPSSALQLLTDQFELMNTNPVNYN
jgi:hypothetical protein